LASAPGARARLALEQAQYMPRDSRHRLACRDLGGKVIGHWCQQVCGTGRFPTASDRALAFSQHPGRVIGRAAQHHAIHLREMHAGFRSTRYPAIEDDGQFRLLLLQAIDPVMVQWGDIPVLFGAEAGEMRHARMHDDRAHA